MAARASGLVRLKNVPFSGNPAEPESKIVKSSKITSNRPSNDVQTAGGAPDANPVLDDVEPGSDADESPVSEPLSGEHITDDDADEESGADDEKIGS